MLAKNGKITLPQEENVALLIVDVQQGFINKATTHIPPLVEKLQKCYKKIFASRFYNEVSSPYRKFLNWERFGKDSSDFPLAFLPNENVTIITKSVYSCVNKDFTEKLKRCNVNEVHICGIDTDICVMKTAVDLFEVGNIRPVVLVNYCASHAGKEVHDAALMIIPRYIGNEQVFTGIIDNQ